MQTRMRLTGDPNATADRLRALLLWLAVSACTSPALAGTTDHVLLIDNSLTTGEVDPERRLRDGLAQLIHALPSDDRLAIVLYDDLATPIAPLTKVGESPRAKLSIALNALTFTSNLTNPAAGLERAIYELSAQRRPDADARILLVHTSRLRTGDPEQDTAFRAWADKVLIERATQQGITVDVISLGAAADQEFGRRLAARSGGRHLALAAAERLTNALIELGTARRASPAGADAAAGERLRDDSDPDLTQEQLEPGEEAAAAGPDSTYDPSLTGIERLLRLAPPRAGSPNPEQRATGEGDPDPETTRLPHPRNTIDPEAGAPLATGIGWRLTDPLLLLAAGLAVALLIAIGGGLYRARRWRPQRDPTQAAPKPSGQHAVRLVDLKRASGKDVYVLNGRMARVCRNASQDTFNVVCITIPDDVISREHAFIEFRQGTYWVTDPGSNNGTFVNDQRVHGGHALQDGDRLRFATFEFLFQDETESAATLIPGASTELAPTLDPMKTQVAPRPLVLVCDPEDRTIANTLAYRPTANEDPIRPVSRFVKPAS